MAYHEVIVGNIGKVTHTGTYREAEICFNEYRHQSVTNYGRAAGEDVTWFRGNKIYKQYIKKGRKDAI